ncbi:SCO family protein [Blastochloris viridis]|uniref:BsSco n=1 Tax=Blastochloris viridis TaxID=1079 RepID=A0A0H5BCH7_BLAVI|nr:SCO family protein [Blastochloris viridis]ALK10168.1 hypothetical protein BVIR_2401 [Blastochloris viridis]BAR99900.1 cytochrome oxidase biogenesis protein Sco1/SenC/PrrC [Blastochloris viridis]CUU42832.1 BsSco [Blastochloris viridis]
MTSTDRNTRLRRRHLLQLALAATAAGLTGTATALWPQRAAADPAADGGWGATLTTHTGEPVGGETLKGRPYALYFGYTYCPDICPTSMADLTDALARLDAAGVAGSRDLKVYFVSVDPERDTAALLKTYLGQNFDARIVGLTGTPEAIAKVAWTFRAIFKKTGTGKNYAFTHTASVFLVDRNGRLVGKMPHGGSIERKVEQLTALLSDGSS